MKSTARFLLGSVLGMVVGYLLAQKSGKKPATSVSKEPVSYVRPKVDVRGQVVGTPAAEVTESTAGSGEVPAAERLEAETPAAERLEAEAVATSDVPELIVTPEILYEPVPGSGWEPPPSLVVTEEVIEEVLPVVPDLPATTEATTSEATTTEATTSEPTVSEPTVSEPTVSEPTVSQVTAGEEALSEAALVDDLKARIEATRRRIRQELEQPFTTLMTQESEEPKAAVPEAEGPQVAQQAEPEAKASEAQTEAEAEDLSVETAGAPRERVDLDYESIRQRIEQVRSRLKAKAFDAMMSGEAALLGRDTGRPAKVKQPSVPVVDAEIDQTIETTLREEEI